MCTGGSLDRLDGVGRALKEEEEEEENIEREKHDHGHAEDHCSRNTLSCLHKREERGIR